MSKTRTKLCSEVKWRDCSNVSKTIEKQGIEGILEYCANGTIGVGSPMSKTKSNQGIEDKLGDQPNLSKTITKQGTEGRLQYCANGPMTIGKSDFEGVMTTYAQKWNTA